MEAAAVGHGRKERLLDPIGQGRQELDLLQGSLLLVAHLQSRLAAHRNRYWVSGGLQVCSVTQLWIG